MPGVTRGRAEIEWIDHIGDSVGDAITEVDFDKVQETLALANRDSPAPGSM